MPCLKSMYDKREYTRRVARRVIDAISLSMTTMEKKLKRIQIRVTEAQFDDVARQAHLVGWPVSRYALAALQAYAQSVDDAERVQAAVQAQTTAIVDALAEQFERAESRRRGDISAAVRRIAETDDARDGKLRAELERVLNRILARLRALEGRTASNGAETKE